MSNCSNCYNGCTEIVSDRCVKYTGIDVPVLGIQTGDSLSFVEQALITFLTSTLDGTGVKIDLGTTVVCELVNKYLPTCKDLSIVDISKALIEAACDLQVQVNVIVAELAVLNADYTIGCLTEVTASSDTHAIVQATITKLCSVNSSVTTILNQLPLYVTKSEFCTLLAQCTSQNPTIVLISNKMVPYAIIPFYPPSPTFISTNFGSSGAGVLGSPWEKIYLCNGDNGTPDLRGRALTGVINGVPGPQMSSVVNPAASLANPNYSLGDIAGANEITLGSTQIPPLTHTHGNTASSTVPPHSHKYNTGSRESDGWSGDNDEDNLGPLLADTTPATLIVSTTVNIESTTLGGGLPHPNIQPVMACYYIQYRP